MDCKPPIPTGLAHLSATFLPSLVGQISGSLPPVPRSIKRGASRSSRTLGAGCDGRFGGALTSGAKADGEGVWSWHPDAGVKFAEVISADDGGKRARSPGRARRKPLTPSRREGRTVSVNLW